MWSNRLVILGAAAAASLSLSACAGANNPGMDSAALTPTERYSIQVTPHPQEVRLATHEQGLSANQASALSEFARDWMRAEGGPITVQTPAENASPGAAYRTTEGARRFLLSQGVAPDRIRVVAYRAEDEHAPIIVGYLAYAAHGPDCSAAWGNLTASVDNNLGNANFGCAVTANVAAAIANPGDLVQPRTEDPVDAARRGVVLGHYRAGENTSSNYDHQASGTVSSAVN